MVKTDGETRVHLTGQDWLTRAILFNRERALAWVRKLYGAEAAFAQGGTDNDAADGTLDDDGGS